MSTTLRPLPRFVALAAVVVAPLCSAVAAPPEPVTLQLKWTHAFQFAGYYAAQAKGYYREAGLDVTIEEAVPGVDPVKRVLDGHAQYGVGTSSLLLERRAGKPVVVLGVIFQHSAYVLVARQTEETQGIHDLVDKRIMLEPQSDELIAYLQAEGVPTNRIQRVEHSYNVQDLIDGKVDAIAGYVVNQPYFLDRAGVPYQVYTPRSAGIDFYGDNLFTTERELREHPNRARAFREASLRGWQYALEHPEEIIDLILARYSQRNSRDYLLFESRHTMPLIRPDLVEVGYMYPGRWRHIAETYASLGMLPRDFPLKGFLYEAEPQRDVGLFYRGLGLALLAALVAGLTALHIHRINRRLRGALAESRRTEESLQQERSNFTAIFESSPIGLMVLDEDLNIVHVNAAVHQIAVGTEGDLSGRRPGQAFHCVHDAKDPRGCGFAPQCPLCPLRNGVAAVLAGGAAVHDVELALELLRGGKTETVWIRMGASPLQLEGRRHVIVALKDATVSKKAQALIDAAQKETADLLATAEKSRRALLSLVEDLKSAQSALIHERNLLYALMDNLPDRVYFKDAQGRFLKVSRAYAALLGIRAPDEAVGRTEADFLPVETAARIRDDDDHILQTGQPLIAKVVQEESAAGKAQWVSISKAPIQDKDGHMAGLVAISRDITQEIILQQQLQQASKMDAIGRLAGGVAHDFNNLLQAILGFTELLLERTDQQDSRHSDLKEIEKAAKRAADLTRQLLAFGRKQMIVPRVLDINQRVSGTENMLRRLLGEDIRLVTQLDPGLKRVRADSGQIDQIIMNLAVNARDAMSGGGRLAISTTNVLIQPEDVALIPDARSGEFICLSVSDTGSGMSKNVMDHIFEPFFTTKEQGKGTGLGLAVIYGVVQQSGGWINVYSQLGQGSTFKIYLPVYRGETEAADEQSSVTIPAARPKGRGERILLVEDEPGVRNLATQTLQSSGYEVTACISAEEAEAIFHREGGRFDLLFSDVVLPARNGIELADLLRARRTDLPVLLCSGYADDRARWASIEQKGYRFFQKPYPVSALLQTVRAVLDAQTGKTMG